VVETVLTNLLPSIRLVPQHPRAGEEDRVGSCRIGCVPDLPQGVEWPHLATDTRRAEEPITSSGAPLSFLLQVSLAEVAFVDLE
jgi:hypothetical protein